MDIDLQLENFILEATTPRPSKTICWVTGTDGLDDESFVYTLRCEVLVPESIMERHEQECNDKLGLPLQRVVPLDLRKWNSDEKNLFPNIETFTKFILDDKLEEAKQIRDWARLYPVTPSEFSTGICRQMENNADYEELVRAWRHLGYSREGTWAKDGIKRHDHHMPDCPYCQARLDKNTAAGTPILSGGAKLSKETTRKKFSGHGSDLGYACGDPVRPKYRTNIIGAMPGTRLRSQDTPESKLWPHTRNKYLAKFIQKMYAPLVLQTVKDKLAVPPESESLFYGPITSTDNWPSNMKFIMIDEEYSKAHLGKPEIQHRVWGPRNKLEYLTSHTLGSDTSDTPKFLDLSKIEKHYAYTFKVEIYLDTEYAWMEEGKDKESVGTKLKRTLINKLSAALIKFRHSKNPDKYQFDHWIDSNGNCFPIYKIPTGIKGLDALLNPFMPSKTVIEDGEVFTDEYVPTDIIPQHSAFWSYGGRDATHLYESLNKFVEIESADELIDDTISLAPFNQFAPYPVDREGNVYIIRQHKMFKLKDGRTVIGRIVKDSWRNFKGDLNTRNYKKDQQIGHYQVEVLEMKADKKKSKTFNVPMLNNPIVLGKMSRRIVNIRKSDIEDQAEARFDSVDFASVHKLHGTVSLFNDSQEEAKAQAQAKLLLKQMTPEQIDRLFQDIKTDIEGGKIDRKRDIVQVYSPAMFITKPEMIFGKLITELQKPREVTDNGRWYQISERNRDGDPIAYAPCIGKTVFSWEAIENPEHPNHPYFRGADGEYYHPLHADEQLKAYLIGRGDVEDKVTKQWIRQKLVQHKDEDGFAYDEWIRYNSKEYLNHHLHLEGIKEDLRPRLRPSAKKSNNLKDILVGLKDTSINPESILSQQAYERKMTYKQKDRDPSLAKFKKLWTINNIKRIYADDGILYPSPGDELCPSYEYWMDNGNVSPDTAEMNLDSNLPPETLVKKKYWPCRQCGGAGAIEEQPCPRCQDPKYKSSLITHTHGYLQLTKEVWKDLWTGREFIQYIWACRRYIKAQEQGDSEGTKHISVTERQAKVRNLLLEHLIVPYDMHVILDKIKYKPGEPVDLKGLSKLDMLMLPINQPEAPPFVVSPENAEKVSQWISAMIAIHTQMTMKVLPPELQALLANQEISPQIRVDTLYTDIFTAQEIENINNVDDNFIQKLAQARSSTETDPEKTDQDKWIDKHVDEYDPKGQDESDPELGDPDTIKKIAKELDDEDEEDEGVDEDEETPEEKEELRDVFHRETEIQAGRLSDVPEEIHHDGIDEKPPEEELQDYSKLAPETPKPELEEYDIDEDPWGIFANIPKPDPQSEDTEEDDDTQQSQ